MENSEMSEKIFLNSVSACDGLVERFACCTPLGDEERELQYIKHEGRIWSKHAGFVSQVAGWDRFALGVSALFRKIGCLFGTAESTAKEDWEAAWKGKRVYVIYTPKDT